MSTPTDKPKRRLRLRWSMRAMFLGVTIVCVWFGLLSQRSKEQKRAVEALRSQDGGGVGVHYDYEFDEQWNYITDASPPGPEWLRDLIGVDYFADVTVFELSQLFSSGHAPPSAVMPSFGYSGVCDEDIIQLRNLKSLKLLALDGGRAITDETLRNIKDLSQLKLLSVGGTQVSDNGLRYLAGLKALTHLSLRSTNITNEGLEYLKPLMNLESVELRGTHVTKEGIADLQRALPNCEIESDF